MSPPCQPYSRQGKILDAEDARAKPLLHIISVLKEVVTPPEAIVLENVKNFEQSESFARLREVLELRGYEWRSFLLSPRQFGFPNSRLRFYMVAKLRKGSEDAFPLVPSILSAKSPEGSRADLDSLEHVVNELKPWQCLPCPLAWESSLGTELASRWQDADVLEATAEELSCFWL
eukprot:TRINITY_DN9765_c0_g1_i3.p1 TRINITY_DN9765_c0_g1~~TRINITY_DN9765_c0_g1_i3.p1  ORF type:complete len:200 (-),score=24.84 TRINITY_DN9765_c0_g1_i3:213-737(-)